MYKSLLFIAMLATVCSCSKNNDDKNNCANTPCTLVFTAVTTEVKDSSGKDVELDRVYTVNMDTGDTLSHEQISGNNDYVVLDDNYVSMMYNKTYNFLFIGERHNAILFTEPYTISADCCHVSKDTGKDVITVN